ncbi:ester cyclase [Paenibacillus sp. 481]|uniref:ester cyclase n=1 Tax=Paenibacillus sp. 481 TaxID=2835869 RepID=UPI001E2E0477|nr:ester cyclase [Paenibacillus sp. 481]UHA72730.1 ester cyclase [Paenibacillus sp. 481]
MSAEQLITHFFEEVKSGKDPDKAHQYMAPLVKAHQVNAEHSATIDRTPDNYAEHIREFKDMFGDFVVEVQELIAQEQKVYVRWKQTGKHVGVVEGYAPTGKELVEIASAVYRVEDMKIVEYWIQIDRLGMLKQLKQHELENDK